jgi:hypothetical protein
VRQGGLFVELASKAEVSRPNDTQGVNQLILGCASMLGYTNRAKSIGALESAMSLGIRQFDVARSYGYGQAERLLGDFFSANRSSIRITSKYGIAPAVGVRANCIRILRGGVRGLRHLEFVPSSNSRDANGEFWSVKSVLRGLEQSLSELRTDYIDEFLLHSPPVELSERSELFQALNNARRAGKIAKIGVSTDAKSMLSFLECVQCAQVGFNIEHAPVTSQFRAFPKSINHIFGGRGGKERIALRLKGLYRTRFNNGPEHELFAIQTECLEDPVMLNEAMIRIALRAAGADAAVISMSDPRHQANNVAALTAPQVPNQLIEFFTEQLFSPTLVLQ